MDIAGLPRKQGLYDPSLEKDGCGIGFVADVKGRSSHSIVQDGLKVLENLRHRGAQGYDSQTGDGAGLLVQLPHEFLRQAAAELKIKLPDQGSYGVGVAFLPKDAESHSAIVAVIEDVIAREGCLVLGWRDVPVRGDAIGEQARTTEPKIRQFFVSKGKWDEGVFERKIYVIRKVIENTVRASAIAGKAHFHVPSLSSRTLVYKGLLLPHQVARYYPDLSESDFKSAIAQVHSRFSTNTFPTWPLAHPYRYICHNGEINTLKGNVNWMHARQGNLGSEAFGEDLPKLFPIVYHKQSDSACLDNAVEFLVQGGRSLPHAMMILIPEPWFANTQMNLDRRAFYEYHAAMMEPWDGPAAVCFTDGELIGATLDRNGLRPCRYQVTDDDRVVLSSEAGVLPVDPERVVQKGRLQPGRMFIVDTKQGRLLDDEEVKSEIVARKPYRSMVNRYRVYLDELPEPLNVPQPDHANLRRKQKAFGYSVEELTMVLAPMVLNGEEPVSSMGTDTPLAVLSDRPQVLFNYFKQLFAQVTNPPIDPIREALVMSLTTHIGPRHNIMSDAPETCRRVIVKSPILSNADMQRIREIVDPDFRYKTLNILFRAADGAKGLESALDQLCQSAAQAIDEGFNFLILSDRGMNEEWAPIPSLLGVSAVHQHLIKECRRTNTGLIVETGEPRNVHHFACLIGFGAGSVNPYLAFETLVDTDRSGYFPEGIDAQTAQMKYTTAVNKGLLKIFSKMGISAVQSYCGAQIFEAIGLNQDFVDRYFTRTPSRIQGIGLAEIARETLERHASAYAPNADARLAIAGEIHYRAQGEHHAWNPDTIRLLQQATWKNDAGTFEEFSKCANDESEKLCTLRGMLEFDYGEAGVALEEVEPASEIVKRFTTGAMSLGAISPEAHETLAIAMNRIGGKSNSGEGGEDPARFPAMPGGDSKNSAIKQIASARFGVTAHYIANARELQIKMAQGAKPGEGGQLPGYKVDALIARLRHSTPGVQLISPPPHHDIYSIEDLAQLIFDLKNVNPAADVSVKLVAEVGVGTVAAGVAKAHADKILISGDSGGTGASPLASIKYAGIPWEMGLAETQQTLLLNNLRGRVKVEVDGQMKTGRDVIVAALLGAEEFGFATAPLIVQGCIMMRKCHLNTCPVGVATQDPLLRAKFQGQPEHLVNYFFLVAEEVRRFMAKLGYRKFAGMVGQVQRLKVRAGIDHWKAKRLDLTPFLNPTDVEEKWPRHHVEAQNHSIDEVLDRKLLEQARSAIEMKTEVRLSLPIQNTNRATGAMLSGEIAKLWGAAGLPADTIEVAFTGSAGQSFGAFLARGVKFRLEGESNDYLGKGLSGGRIVVVPPKAASFLPEESIIVGNTLLYGATEGEVFIRGVAGERFAVRNSGATAVVEGVGDHGCEYMTGGRVVVLGKTGKNFAAGMSGGIAYVFDEDARFSSRCNLGMVELEDMGDAHDRDFLRAVLQSHAAHTQSSKAEAILSDWHASLAKFVKVMPTDYKRALRGG